MMAIPVYPFDSSTSSGIPFEISRIEDKGVLQQFRQQPRRDRFYVVFWVTDGAGTYSIDFDHYPLKPYTLFCIAPYQVHYWHLTTAVRGYAMLFTEELLNVNLDYNATRFPESFTIFNWETPAGFTPADLYRSRFQALAHILTNEYQTANSFQRWLAIQSALMLFLINAQRAYEHETSPTHSAGDKLIRQFQALVGQHFGELRSVKAYADLLGITTGHLSDTVSALTGQTPSEIIHRRVILEAKRLLIHTEDPVSTVAELLHFQDPSYFGRFFKRETGEAPAAFRNRFR